MIILTYTYNYIIITIQNVYFIVVIVKPPLAKGWAGARSPYCLFGWGGA